MPTKDARPQIDPLAVSEKTAAELLGLSPSSLEKDRAKGHLGVPSTKAGRRVIYQLADLRSWLDAVISKNSSQIIDNKSSTAHQAEI